MNKFLVLFLTLFSLTANAASPVIWAGTRSKNVPPNGFTLTTGMTLDYDGLFNPIANYGFEDAAIPSGWTRYDDGAVAVPVDCTGGSPAIVSAISRTTTAAEVDTGTGGGKLAKGSGDGQGEGWAYDFVLPTHLRSGTVNLNLDVLNSDVDYTSGAFRIYVYDKDNATVITPNFLTCGGGSTPDLATGNCRARLSFISTTADDYRICIHNAVTTSNAYDVFIDNLFVGETVNAITGVTTISFTGARSISPTFTWQRIGKVVTGELSQSVGINCSAAAFTAASATLPSNIRPGGTVRLFIPVQDNSAEQTLAGNLDVLANGSVVINKTLASGAFTNSAPCGFYRTAITWTVP